MGASRMARQVMIDAIRRPLNVPLVSGQRITSSIAGIYSHNPNRAAAFAAETYLPRSFTQVTDLLTRPEVECVYISSHPRHQAHLIALALDAGKHVLCEPPTALTPQETAWLCQRAEERGTIFAVNFALRGEPALMRAAALLYDYTIGDLVSVTLHHLGELPQDQQTWRLRDPGGGLLMDRGIHLFDLLNWLLRDEFEALHAQEGNRALGEVRRAEGGAEEEIMLIGRMRHSRLPVQIYDSWLVSHATPRLTIHGTRGALVAEGWGQRGQESRLTITQANGDSILPLAPGQPYHLSVQRFTQSVVQARKQPEQRPLPPLATGWDALSALETVATVKGWIS
jgi:predicted dehydrogenase